MSNNYLWDASGDPDPEVERLERLLGRFRHNAPPPQFPVPQPSLFSWLLPARAPELAPIAAIFLLMIAAAQMLHRPGPAPGPSSTASGESLAVWNVARLEGSPKVGPTHISGTGRLAVGQFLETDGTSRARLEVGAMGEVEVEPNTRLRLVESRPTEHRLALERGTIHATIFAPPREFIVEIPSAVAIDLGCAYTLHVDETGGGLLRVTFGWVGFERDGRESFIPAGALCRTAPGAGPGTPFFEDASTDFQQALARLDFGPPEPQGRAAALASVLRKARRRDALTLWHLLQRVNDLERVRVVERLASLVPLPRGVTRSGILGGDRHMLDLWWNQLGLGDTNWWRLWERPWPPEEPKKVATTHPR